MSLIRYISTLMLCLVLSVPAIAQSTSQDSIADRPIKTGEAIIKRTLISSIPMIAMALPYTISNEQVKDFRNSYLSTFHNRYDDYLQFVPLAAQLGMHFAGLEGRTSSHSQLLTADALGFGIMMTSVSLTKSLTRVMRPDGSSANSFPSGHTAMAFYSATALHLEYGKRYPWISLAGYLTATGVGIGRIMNNRHWIGDVMVGAAVGIASAEVGYWLSSLLHRRPYIYEERPCYFEDTDLRFYFPWSMSLHANEHSHRFGLGLRWLYDSKYFLALEGSLEGHYTHAPSGEHVFIRNQDIRLGWGREFRLSKRNLSLDLGAFAGLSTDGSIYPAVQVTPRIDLTKRLSWHLNIGYEYHSKRRTAYIGDERFSFKIPAWRLGSAIEVRL